MMEARATAHMKKFAFLLSGLVRNKSIKIELIQKYLQSLKSDQLVSIVMKTANDTGHNALHTLAINGNTAAIKCILDKLSHDQIFLLLKSADKTGCTALHHIAAHGPAAISCLLSFLRQDQIYDVLKIQNVNGNIAILHYTAWKGQASSMKIVIDLLTHAQKFELLKVKNNLENTPLHLAAWCGCVDTIRCILGSIQEKQKVALLNLRRNDGFTPLRVASLRGNDAAVVCLEDCYCSSIACLEEFSSSASASDSSAPSADEVADVKYKQLVDAAMLPLQSKIKDLENLFRQQFSEHLQMTQQPDRLEGAECLPTVECGDDSLHNDLSLRFDLHTIIGGMQPEEDTISVVSMERDRPASCTVINDKGCHDANFNK